MAVTPDYVREVFKGLENGDGAAFFTHVAEALTRSPVAIAARRTLSPVPLPNWAKCFHRELNSIWNISSSKATRRWSNFIPWRRLGTA